MRFQSTIGIVAISVFTATNAIATEPLYDRMTYKGQTGPIFQPGTGWLDLPDSDGLRVLRRESQCSAIGGPRGMYKYEDSKLWITGLHRCGGEVALDRAYPEMPVPSLAVWVSGKLVAKLGSVVCTKPSGAWVFHTEIALNVERGLITSLSEKANDASACV
jgi:hypothetical protein